MAALGSVVGKRAELTGGLVLIGLGCKILVEHQFLSGGGALLRRSVCQPASLVRLPKRPVLDDVFGYEDSAGDKTCEDSFSQINA